MEREEMAAELAHFTAVLRRAISRKEFASNKRATKDVLPPEPEVEAAACDSAEWLLLVCAFGCARRIA